MNKNKKDILGVSIIAVSLFLCIGFFAYGFSQSARLFIGDVTLTDTLSGYLKLNNGLWLDNDSLNGVSKVNTDDIQSGGGIKFASTTTFIDDDGTDLTYNAVAHIFNSGVTLKLPTDSIRFADASKTGTVLNAMGFLKVYVGGEARYIQLYDTSIE